MLIDFKNRESTSEERKADKPATLEEIIQHLEYYKENEKRRQHYISFEKISKIAILTIINEKYEKSKERARSISKKLVKVLADLSKESEMIYEDEVTRSWQLTFTDNKKVPEDTIILYAGSTEDDGVYAWILAENKRKGTLNHPAVHGDAFFHKRKQAATSIPSLFANLAEWLKRNVNTEPLAFGIGYDFDNEDENDWDANLMYRMKEMPGTNNRDQHSLQERFFRKISPASGVQRDRHMHKGLDSHRPQPNRKPGKNPAKEQHIINKKTSS